MKNILYSAGQLVGEVIISGIVTAIVQSALALDTFQGIMLGMTLFICLKVIEVEVKSTRTIDNTTPIGNFTSAWVEIGENVKRLVFLQDRLEGINNKVRQISDGIKVINGRDKTENGLFVKWYDDKIEELLSHISQTIETDSLEYESFIIKEQDRFFSVFQGRPTDFFWATSSCEGISWYLTPNGEIFLRAVETRFSSGLIPSVRRLFMYTRSTELDEFNTRLCFYLHEQSGYEYKIISKHDFEAVLRAFGNKSLSGDFGIYGTHFVWETTPEAQNMINVGRISQNKNQIANYSQLFKDLWAQGAEYKISDPLFKKKYDGQKIDSLRKLAQGRQF